MELGFIDIFKKSRRQINRENQEQGRRGERQIREKYEFSGHEVERTGRGHDFKVSKTNWLTGKKEIKYVEVKTGNSRQSPLQKKKMRRLGERYVVERVGTGLFGLGSTTTYGTPKNPPAGTWGPGSLLGGSAPRKKRSAKKPSSSIWGPGSLLGGSAPRKKRSAKKPSSSIWESPKRKSNPGRKSPTKSSASIWGSGVSTRRKSRAKGSGFGMWS